MITIQNIVLLALAQVSLMVTGVLTGGLARRVGRHLVGDVGIDPDLRMPFWNIALVDWWAIWLILPLVWVTVAVVILNKTAVADRIKRWSFGAGFVLLGGWLILIWLGGLLPLLRGFGFLAGY